MTTLVDRYEADLAAWHAAQGDLSANAVAMGATGYVRMLLAAAPDASFGQPLVVGRLPQEPWRRGRTFWAADNADFLLAHDANLAQARALGIDAL